MLLVPPPFNLLKIFSDVVSPPATQHFVSVKSSSFFHSSWYFSRFFLLFYRDDSLTSWGFTMRTMF